MRIRGIALPFPLALPTFPPPPPSPRPPVRRSVFLHSKRRDVLTAPGVTGVNGRCRRGGLGAFGGRYAGDAGHIVSNVTAFPTKCQVVRWIRRGVEAFLLLSVEEKVRLG